MVVGWSIANQKTLPFVFVAIFLNQTLENNEGVIVCGEGYSNWKKKERFDIHVEGHNSAHNQARNKCTDLMVPNQHIEAVFS